MSATIVLATLNARYQHASFALRYLLANLGDWQPHTLLREYTLQQSAADIVEDLLTLHPTVIGLGVYIWNVEETERVVRTLRRVRPDIVLILGGPEVSYETESQPLCALADYVIRGEADLALPELCREILGTPGSPRQPSPPAVRPVLIDAPVPDLNQVRLPYDLYTDEDLAQRVIYVEASRGCPFTCEFCLSALDIPVRQFPLPTFLDAMERLLERGCRTFKFVDRTFNLNLRVSSTILQFFLDRYRPGLFLHLEMIPDRLPEGLKELIARFPAGALQFEVGLQTWNDEVAQLISRRQDNAIAIENLCWLREQTGVHVHADLIVGLPGEDVASFAAGFDRLVALGPQEIQVGILKRLKGTPIIRHDEAWGMVYSDSPPFEVLRTNLIDFGTMQQLKRLAKVWDLVANSGNFPRTLTRLLQKPGPAGEPSAFWSMWELTAWLTRRTGRTHGIALPRLVELVWSYLSEDPDLDRLSAAEDLLADYWGGGRSDVPRCLRSHISSEHTTTLRSAADTRLVRQLRHQSP